MRQEMSVWCALSSGKCTNSSPLFSFLETMWSSSPNQEWSPPLQTTLFWICLQLFCSFNPHTDIFVLRPVCGVPWPSWDRLWTCQVWPAPRYLPPGLLWLGMCTLKSAHPECTLWEAMAEAIMAANDKQGMFLYYREAELKVNSTSNHRFINVY